MNYINEKIAYIRGLVEGIAINDESKENKVFLAITDALEEIVALVNDLEVSQSELDEYITNIDEDLAEVSIKTDTIADAIELDYIDEDDVDDEEFGDQ